MKNYKIYFNGEYQGNIQAKDVEQLKDYLFSDYDLDYVSVEWEEIKD